MGRSQAVPGTSAGAAGAPRCRRVKAALLTSSAVGVAVATAQPAGAQELELSGFQQFFASAGDSDGDTSDRGFGFTTDTEVHVNGSMMADNGITFGFHVEFEADSGATNNVDENSIWASGDFGKLEFGNNDGVEDTFLINGTSTGVNYGSVGNPTSTFLSSAFTGEARTSDELRIGSLETADATKLSYISPTFGGFNLGFSYTPDTADGASGNDFHGAQVTGFHDNVSFGLGYDGTFDGVSLEAAVVGAFAHADVEPQDDIYGVGGGLALGVSGFTVAAGAIWDDLNGNGGEGWSTDLGLAYGSGPWFFSLNGIYSKDEDSGDELLGSSANVRYNLAPGVSIFAVGYLGEEDLGANDTNDILAISSGIRLSF
ncbi:porin [Pelagibius marinus]|uniref:porin n=1 Tax=Pelagibius marinus TaxID=2762760 RepID=UPI001872EB1A|nr:porin [Pelagibius marinus]